MPLSYPLRLVLDVKNVQRRDEALTRAVENLIPEALRHRAGISVTRHSGSVYNVAVDESVPCGEVHERCTVSRTH